MPRQIDWALVAVYLADEHARLSQLAQGVHGEPITSDSRRLASVALMLSRAIVAGLAEK